MIVFLDVRTLLIYSLPCRQSGFGIYNTNIKNILLIYPRANPPTHNNNIFLFILYIVYLCIFTQYSPELNPAEKIWQKMKRAFSGKLHQTLDNVSEFITNQVTILTNQQVKNIFRYDYIFLAPYWTNTY